MPRTKKEQVYDAAKYVLDLRARRKALGFELRHWYVHDLAYEALAKAAERENRKIQQYVTLNIWKLIPEDLRPKEIPVDSLILPKQKKVRLHLTIKPKIKGSKTLVLQDGLIHDHKKK
jgi:hypothetical protein